jgi:hypothetical protein
MGRQYVPARDIKSAQVVEHPFRFKFALRRCAARPFVASREALVRDPAEGLCNLVTGKGDTPAR